MPHLPPVHARHAAVLLALLPCACAAQVEQQAPVSLSTPDHPYVLHVYTDLLQLPALVLNWRGRPSPNLTAADFHLQLDRGPLFKPAAVHLEGNEPLNLALVLDASGAEDYLLKALPNTSGHGFPRTLLPHDHIAVYAFDCRLFRSKVDTEAEVATSHDGVAHLLSEPTLHQAHASSQSCGSAKHLLDAVAAAAAELATEPGRRAILVISDGLDGGSITKWSDLREFATGRSIAVFGLKEASINDSRGPLQRAAENPLDLLAAATGGTSLTTLRGELASQLDDFVALLRSRYIIQFPRPEGPGGWHDLEVHVKQFGATVHTAGIAVPLRDATLMNDPSTVPSDPRNFPYSANAGPSTEPSAAWKRVTRRAVTAHRLQPTYAFTVCSSDAALPASRNTSRSITSRLLGGLDRSSRSAFAIHRKPRVNSLRSR